MTTKKGEKWDNMKESVRNSILDYKKKNNTQILTVKEIKNQERFKIAMKQVEQKEIDLENKVQKVKKWGLFRQKTPAFK